MASLRPRIHSFSEMSESFRLVDADKYCEFDAYLIATCRVEGRPLADGEGLDAAVHEVEAAALFFPGRQWPHPGAKPRVVTFCGVPLAVVPGPPWAMARSELPLDLPLAAPLVWDVKEDDGVPAWTGEAPGFAEPYVWTAAPPELPIAAPFDVEATVGPMTSGQRRLPPADLLSLSLTYHTPGADRPRPGNSMRIVYPGPVDGDLYVLATRLEKLLDDQPPYYAAGQASAVARALRLGEALVKVPGAADQRWRLISVVEAEVPVVWR